MIYGYIRVSTKKQLEQNGLEAQRQELIANNVPDDNIFEEQFTGTAIERPEFAKLLERLKDGDTLVVTKLDRIARSTVDGITLIRELVWRGIKVHIINMGIADNSAMGKLMITVMMGFAEFERDMIVERTQAGKEIAKQDPNFREGRPPKHKKTAKNHAMELLEEGRTYKQVSELTGISISTLHRFRRQLQADKHESTT